MLINLKKPLAFQGYNLNKTLILNCTFMNNISPLNFLQHGNFTIEKCVFFNNIGYAGGAIYYYETNSNKHFFF